MLRFCSLLPLLALLPACDSQPTAPTTAAAHAGAPAAAKSAARRPLEFGGPVFVDSSAFVLYPLVLNSVDQGDDEYGSSRGRANAYWNIAFYNPRTGDTHLLAEGRKLLIESYGAPESGSGAASDAGTAPLGGAAGGAVPAGQQLYYTVRTDDFNRDGALNEKDPAYLFVSDRAGRRFRPVSPAGYHVHGWEVVPGTSQVLLRATPATADNRHFYETSHAEPFVYDLQADAPARPVFGPAFEGRLRQQLGAQWPALPPAE